MLMTGYSAVAPPETLELALLALAVSGGNAADALRHLSMLEPPVKVHEATLRQWKTKYAQRYSEIVQDRAPLIESIVLEKIRETIVQAGTAQTRALEKILVKLESDDLDAKDLVSILKGSGVSLGINVEKLLLFTNRPTAITEKRDVAELLQSLSKRVPGLIQPVESVAVEVDPPRALEAGDASP